MYRKLNLYINLQYVFVRIFKILSTQVGFKYSMKHSNRIVLRIRILTKRIFYKTLEIVAII